MFGRTSSALAVLFLSLAACTEMKGVEVDARQLVPADASVVFGFELEPLRTSPLGPALYAALQSGPDATDMLSAVPNCSLDMAAMRGMFATKTDAVSTFVAVLESPGIGTEENVRCIETELAKSAREVRTGVLVFETKGDVRVTPQEQGGYMVILNKNTLVVMDRSWETAVFDAIAKPEVRNTTTPLAKAMAAVDPSTDLWFAVALSDSDRAGLTYVKGAESLQVLAATVDFASGMKLDLALDTKDAASANTLATSLTEMIGIAKPGLKDAGLPETLLDGLKLSTSDVRVTAKLDVAKDALPGLVTALTPLFAGG